MIQIFYKKSGLYNIFFCATYYDFEKEHNCHCLEINEGALGEINNCEVIITENYTEIEEAYDSIKMKYPDRQPETIKIKRFSQKLDNVTMLTNQHWVVLDEIVNSKTV